MVTHLKTAQAIGISVPENRAAAAYTLIETCKFNEIDPQAWFADVLARLPDPPASQVAELLPWNWKAARLAMAA